MVWLESPKSQLFLNSLVLSSDRVSNSSEIRIQTSVQTVVAIGSKQVVVQPSIHGVHAPSEQVARASSIPVGVGGDVKRGSAIPETIWVVKCASKRVATILSEIVRQLKNKQILNTFKDRQRKDNIFFIFIIIKWVHWLMGCCGSN